MPRKSEPYWHPVRKRWRVRVLGAEHFAPATIGQDDRAKAWAWLDSLQQTGKPLLVVQGLTVYQLSQLYLSYLRQDVTAGLRNAVEYKSRISHLKRFCGFQQFGGIAIETASPGHLEAFLRAILLEGLSANYRRSICKTVQAMFNWAARPVIGRNPERLLQENPLRGTARPSVPRINRYHPAQEIRRFLRLCWATAHLQARQHRRRDGKNAVLLIQFLRLTGARPGEACSMLWADIRWEEGYIELPINRHKTGQKTGTPRTIYLTPRVVRLLRSVERSGVRLDGHVFGHQLGPWKPTALAHKFCRWRDAMDVDKTIIPYTARHAFCTEALLKGASYADLAKMVGNSPATLERSYDHVVHKHLAARAIELERRKLPG